MADIDRDLARLALKVADFLSEMPDTDGGLDYYVSRVTFAYSGDDVPGVSVVPDEHGTYEINVAEAGS
ncbi:MAG: hypothetical protein ACRCYR_03590 [Phycicoccus sp.]